MLFLHPKRTVLKNRSKKWFSSPSIWVEKSLEATSPHAGVPCRGISAQARNARPSESNGIDLGYHPQWWFFYFRTKFPVTLPLSHPLGMNCASFGTILPRMTSKKSLFVVPYGFRTPNFGTASPKQTDFQQTENKFTNMFFFSIPYWKKCIFAAKYHQKKLHFYQRQYNFNSSHY